MDKPREILKLASKLSRKYYGKPLVVVHSGDRESDRVVNLVINTLEPEEYELVNEKSSIYRVVNGAVAHRMSVVAHSGSAFAVKGAIKDEPFSYFFTKEVHDGKVKAGLLQSAMSEKLNVIANPYAEG